MYLMISQMGLRGGTTMYVAFAVATAISLLCLPTKLIGSIARTTPPLSFVYLPATFSAGDTIQMEFSLGEPGNEAGPATSFSFVHDYSDEWFKINAASNITANLDGSWACADGNCEVEITVDHQAKKIHVTVSRLDDELQMGAGEIVRLDGIIIEIDIVHNKMSWQDLEFKYQSGKFHFEYEKEKIQQIDIFNLSGQFLRSVKYAHNRVKFAFNPPLGQVIVVKVRTEKGFFEKKMVFNY